MPEFDEGNQKGNPPENRSETPTGEINTINNIQKTTDMEVHHHPLLEHKPKPWKEYILEGLMIFIAVTMGFFAESYREHLVDLRKENEVVVSLFADLRKDTANLNTIIHRYMPEHMAWEDSAESYIESLPFKGNERKITLALVNATNWNFYSPPQVSLEILKNSGNFNLIKNETIKTEIVNFNSLVNTYVNYSQFTLSAEHIMDTTTAGLIDRSAIRILVHDVYLRTNAQFGSIPIEDIPLTIHFKTYDRSRFVNFVSKMDGMDYLLNDLTGLYEKILHEESLLLMDLNREYHLLNQ